MRRGLFVTGTDTNVGKTVVAAALMHRYRSEILLRYWKPIQTGIEKDDDTSTVRELGCCREIELFTKGYRLPQPVSPHLAALWSHTGIRISGLQELIAGEPESCWVVEGAGGVLVPLNESELVIDLMVHLAMPVLVVARSALGTINHTLLTLEAIRSRALNVAGVVMVGERNRENRDAIEKYGDAVVLGEMPFLSDLTAQTVRDWAIAELDPRNVVTDLLR
jgi:dethiobiotin synthase